MYTVPRVCKLPCITAYKSSLVTRHEGHVRKTRKAAKEAFWSFGEGYGADAKRMLSA